MSNYIYTNDGLVNADYLKHKKQYAYISKKRVNGKWRYYYYNPTTDEFGRPARTRTYTTDRKAAELIDNMKRAGISRAGDRPGLETMTDKKRKTQRHEVMMAEKKYAAKNRMDDSRREKKREKKKYKLERSIVRGKKKVTKFFNRLFD